MSSPTIALTCEMLSANTWRTTQTLALLQLRGNQFQIFSGATSATGARLFISDDQVGTSEAFFRCTKLGTNFFEITTEGRVLAGFGGGGGAPDLSFYYDDDTGIRRSAEDVIEVDCGGLEIVKFDGASAEPGLQMQAGQTLQLGPGLASLPAINFGQATGDSNTGFYQVAADQIGVSTGGTLRATFNSSGLTLSAPLPVGSGGTGITAFGNTARIKTPGTSSTISVPTATVTLLSTFTNEVSDTNNLWNNSTSRTQTLPAGLYAFSVTVAADTGSWNLAVYDDGALSSWPGNVGVSSGAHPTWSGFIEADGTSVYDFRVSQGSGGSLNVYDDTSFAGVALVRIR